MSKLAAYNFLAGLQGVQQYADNGSFIKAVSDGVADSRCIPFFRYHVYNIDTKQIVATVWGARDGFEWVKTANDIVNEHYREVGHSEGLFGIAYDLNTQEPIEKYILSADGITLSKYDWVTGEKTGFTTNAKFHALPENFKVALLNFPDKDQISYWAEKPYGRIVGVEKEDLDPSFGVSIL